MRHLFFDREAAERYGRRIAEVGPRLVPIKSILNDEWRVRMRVHLA